MEIRVRHFLTWRSAMGMQTGIGGRGAGGSEFIGRRFGCRPGRACSRGAWVVLLLCLGYLVPRVRGRGVVSISRMERHRGHGVLLAAGAVRSPPEPGVASVDRTRSLFTRPDPGPHLSVGRGGKAAVAPLPGPIQRRTPVEEGSPAAPVRGDASSQRPGLSHTGDRRQQRLRLLQRIRPDFVRRGRPGALALVPGALHQPYGSGRFPHSGRRQGPDDLRPGKRILFCGGGSNDGPGSLACGNARALPGDSPLRCSTVPRGKNCRRWSRVPIS